MNSLNAPKTSNPTTRTHLKPETHARFGGFRFAVAVASLSFGLTSGGLVAPPVTAAELPGGDADPALASVPFQRGTAKDSFDRTITYYLSRPTGNEQDTKRPVVLLILGSGCQSVFTKRGEMVFGSYQNPLQQEAKGRARVLIVEKPGVKFLDAPSRPGSAEGASEEFLKEHTLERWAEANAAALRAVWTLPGIDAARTLVIGHSEGGIVAARVAAELAQVTHVASLSGGGPTQLFDLVDFQRQPRPDDKPGDAERRVRKFYDEWAKVRADPESISRFWLAHPYRRWSSFLNHTVTEELLRGKAKIYLVQGALDTSVSVKSFDVLLAELKARGRDVTAERIEGADHGFRTQDTPQGSPEGMKAVFGRLLGWFLAEEAKEK
jgi:pimeloyl-ACP methyl ester carboxylesterase